MPYAKRSWVASWQDVNGREMEIYKQQGIVWSNKKCFLFVYKRGYRNRLQAQINIYLNRTFACIFSVE